MKKLFVFFFSCLLLLNFVGAQPAHAADFRSGDTIVIPAQTPNLQDLYLFGGSIRVDSPVTNDIVAGGGDITINQPVTGSIILGGGDINLNGTVGNTVRAGGGNIRIDGAIARDLVVSGGSITVTKNASIGGDVLFGGGELILDAPVGGKVHLGGGEVTINNTIRGDVNAAVGKLTLGPNARIAGNLNYSAEKQAEIAPGAVIRGQTNYTPREDTHKEKQDAQTFLTGGALYKLVADILISVLLIFFFARGITAVLNRMTTNAVQSGLIGFGFLFLFPMIAFLALILIWLGIAAFLSYALLLIVSLFIAKIFVGWFIMRWWQNRNKKHYILDWKAGVIGPIILFLIAAIPVLGWIVAAILLFAATGALIYEVILHIKNHNAIPQKAIAKKK